MKIAIVNHPQSSCPPTGADSISIWSHAVAQEISKGMDVRVYARSTPDQPTRETAGGVDFRRVSISRDLLFRRFARLIPGGGRCVGLSFLSPGYFRGYIDQVGQDLRRSPCEIVHVHNLWQFLPRLRRHAPESRLVLHMHGDWLAQLPHDQTAEALSHADLLVGCSDYVTDAIRSAMPDHFDRCRTVPNGVDTTAYSPAAKDEPSSGDPRVLFVGRISPEKGIHVLIEACRGLFEQFPRLQVDIVGPYAPTPRSFLVDLAQNPEVKGLERFYAGSYFEHLRELVPQDQRERVHFLGLVSHKQLPELYRRASLLVNPSFSESFGMSLIEAQACATPAVATRVGGMVEIVDHDRNGLLVEPGDAKALESAVRHLLEDSGKRREMGMEGRRTVLRRFSWPRVTERLLSAYETIPSDRESKAACTGSDR